MRTNKGMGNKEWPCHFELNWPDPAAGSTMVAPGGCSPVALASSDQVVCGNETKFRPNLPHEPLLLIGRYRDSQSYTFVQTWAWTHSSPQAYWWDLAWDIHSKLNPNTCDCWITLVCSWVWLHSPPCHTDSVPCRLLDRMRSFKGFQRRDWTGYLHIVHARNGLSFWWTTQLECHSNSPN